MISSIQSSENAVSQPLKNFKGIRSRNSKKSLSTEAQVQALETKYSLACLLAATTQLENVKLKHDLANATALMIYSKAC